MNGFDITITDSERVDERALQSDASFAREPERAYQSDGIFAPAGWAQAPRDAISPLAD